MALGRTILPAAVLLVTGVAVALVFAVNLTAGLSFVTGVALGAVSLGSVAFGVYGYARGGGGVWRALAALWRWGHLPVVAALVWLALTKWHADPVWLTIGYTVALVVFVVVMAGQGTARRAQARRGDAEE